MAHALKEMQNARREMTMREERGDGGSGRGSGTVRSPRRKRSSDPKTRRRSRPRSGKKLWLVRHMAQLLRIDSSAIPSIGGRRMGMLAHVKACPTFSPLLDALSAISYWTAITCHPQYERRTPHCLRQRPSTVSRHVSAAACICPITSWRRSTNA